MLTKIVSAVADLQHRHARGADVSGELSEHVIMSIKLNFVLNMKEAGTFETSLICCRSTWTRITAAIHDKSYIAFHVLLIDSNRMVWYSDGAVVFLVKITVVNIARVFFYFVL
jgi:hypothetical protein